MDNLSYQNQQKMHKKITRTSLEKNPLESQDTHLNLKEKSWQPVSEKISEIFNNFLPEERNLNWRNANNRNRSSSALPE